MNTQIRKSRARYGRLAAVALTGAVAGVIFVPLGLGVASASAGFSTVQAGGPPAPAPVRHVTKPVYVQREKRILRSPHWHMPNIEVFVHNRNHSRNHKREQQRFRHHEHDDVVKDEVTKPAPEPPVKEEPVKDDNKNWWWPDELS